MKKYLKRILLVIVFLSVVVFDVIVTVYVSRNLLDNDASGEMLLSKCLYDEKSLVCPDWEYATEIRIANQLIFAPFFGVFSEWSSVRIAGTLVIQMILLLTFVFLLRSASLRTDTILLGCSLLLLPYCVAYGRITLYHCYYALYISTSFLIVGMALYYLRASRPYIPAVMMALLCLLGCLHGIRITFIAVIPLCGLMFLFFLREKKRKYLAVTVICGLAGLAGLIMFSMVVSRLFHLNMEFNYHPVFKGISEIYIILFSILRQFGYRSMIERKSFLGVMSLAGIGTAVYAVIISARAFLKKKAAAKEILKAMFLVQLLLNAMTFLCFDLPYSSRSDYARYLVPASVWIIPLLCVQFEAHHSRFWRICFYAVLAVFTGNGIINACFFLDTNHFSQDYDGLPFKNTESVSRFDNAVSFIRENGYDVGYAFSEINSLSEHMNGFPIIGLAKDGGCLSYFDWLTRRSWRDLPADKAFLIGDYNEICTFISLVPPETAEIVYREKDDLYLLHISDPEGFRAFMKRK